MKFCVEYFFSKCKQARRKLQICSLLLNKSLTEDFVYCAVNFAVNFNILYKSSHSSFPG